MISSLHIKGCCEPCGLQVRWQHSPVEHPDVRQRVPKTPFILRVGKTALSHTVLHCWLDSCSMPGYKAVTTVLHHTSSFAARSRGAWRAPLTLGTKSMSTLFMRANVELLTPARRAGELGQPAFRLDQSHHARQL